MTVGGAWYELKLYAPFRMFHTYSLALSYNAWKRAESNTFVYRSCCVDGEGFTYGTSGNSSARDLEA